MKTAGDELEKWHYNSVFDYFSQNMFIVWIKEKANDLLVCKN